jgi:putative flippase GtrA
MNEVVKFVVVGGISALLNWSSRFLFSIWLSYELSIVLSFFIGLTSGFLLMKIFVFQKSEKPFFQQAAYFLGVNMLALALTWTISVYLAKTLFPAIGFRNGADGMAHLIGISAPIMTSYFGHKYLTFK